MASMLFNSFTLYSIAIFACFPFSTVSQPHRNATLGSSIVADGSNATWASPSGDFAFGFRRVAPEGYLLAIWLDKIPEKTIVWSANRDSLARPGSRIQLSSDGRFQLDDPTGRNIWDANLPNPSDVTHCAVLDTGNLVLASKAMAVRWQSFDWPTDTMLPTQPLNRGVSLVSSFLAANYSSGRFRLIMQNNGDLVLTTINFPAYSVKYWSRVTNGSGYQLKFNHSGYVYLSARNGTVLGGPLFSGGDPSDGFYQRLVLEYDGVLRHYVYPKSANSSTGRLTTAWSLAASVPSDICESVAHNVAGAGACGFNGLCSMGSEQRPTCGCPEGYSRMDQDDPLSGCKPDFPQQICGRESRGDGVYWLSDMSNTDWRFNDYQQLEPVSEDQCRQACLSDCFCAVARFKDNKCWKKRHPLANGHIDSRSGGKSLIKVSNISISGDDNKTAGNNNGERKKSRTRSTLIIAGSVLSGGFVLSSLLFSVLVLCLKMRNEPSIKQAQQGFVMGLNLRSFTFRELHEATNGFKEELGSGACSTVHKGTLEDEDGKPPVAVKRLDKLPRDADQEFKAEVSSIGRTNHRNLVRLLGYCDEGQNRLLVYEFMPNGSLADYLFEKRGDRRPNWYRRIQIAFATARGLLYLHEECSPKIIHCDIKPQNVLLDETLTPKISDFGLAKLLRIDQTRTTTGIRGTRGYVAPEWFRNMPITAKVDVYSFGILLLELLCCRRHVEASGENEEEAIILADYAYDCYREGVLHSLVADDEEALGDMECFEKCVMVAIWCIQEDSSMRPNTRRVMKMLEGSVEVPSPPDPSPLRFR